MGCTVNLNTIRDGGPNGLADAGVWVYESSGEGTTTAQLYLCRDCINDPNNPVTPPYDQPEAIDPADWNAGEWTIPDTAACGTYAFKYVTEDNPTYTPGSECLDCNSCVIYYVTVLEGPEKSGDPAAIEICKAENNQEQLGLNLWALFDCAQVTQALDPTYGCTAPCNTQYITRPPSCIVKDALQAIGGAGWNATTGIHLNSAFTAASENCNDQEYSVELEFISPYNGLANDYDPTEGDWIPNGMDVGDSVQVCVTVTTNRTGQNVPSCLDCEVQVCVTINVVAADNAGPGGTAVACN
jgi:hypothetical protein